MRWKRGCLFVAAVLLNISGKAEGLMFRLPVDTTTENILHGDVNATLFGGHTLVDGVRGKAMSFNMFNDVDQYAVFDPHWCFTQLKCNSYSFVMWLKFHQSTLDGIDEDEGVFSSGGHGNGKVSFGGVALFIEKDGPLKLRIKKRLNSMISAWTCYCNVTAGWAERWIHVAGTWSVGGGVKLYIDGVLSGTGDREGILNPEDPVLPKTMHVGKLNSGNKNYGQFVLDEWYFWNLELSGDQVAQMYSAYQTGPLSLAMDGNLATCLDVNQMMLGEMTLFKDAEDTTMVVEVSYSTNVNCRKFNTLHYHKVVPDCSYWMRATLKTGSTHTGSTCRYKVLCDHGNMTCNLELMIIDKSVDYPSVK